ncbi:MAG: cobaltochelatase subunit CobN, partial [Bryobacteraceae bacterium]|nr:cobaltochelatase subunit CobN [Bryobacteraceae bacterium]
MIRTVVLLRNLPTSKPLPTNSSSPSSSTPRRRAHSTGGLNAATRAASGRVPEFLIANARKAGSERYDEANYFVRRELATRLENEKWIEGMKSAGYAGAQQISKEIEHLYGFRATAPEQVDPEVWQQLLDTYIRDKRNLGLEKWFRESNPYARQMVAARLIEIDRQGVYRYSAEDRRTLVSAYIKSVNESGVSCYANACGNRKLIRHVAQVAREIGGMDAKDVQRYEIALQRTTTPATANLTSHNAKRGPPVRMSGASPLRDMFNGVRIFDAGPIQLRAPETALGWIMLLLPVPFGIA